MTTNGQAMQAKTTVHDLYKTMVALRQDILSESENLLGEDRSQIVRDEYLASARNLACYLSLRRRDLRDLQAVLMQYGLSSLGRSESRVIPTLDAVITTLAALDQLEGLKGPGYALDQFFYGANQLTHQADAILDRGQHGRSTRIMVTLPTEAAEDQSLIQALVKQGVECVRINCAHDDPLVWGALIANVRQAEQDDQRAEPVRVLMDLAGPKVRTILPKEQHKVRVAIGDYLLLARAVANQPESMNIPQIGCTLEELHDQLRVGAHVWIDDGQIGAQIVEISAEGALLRVFQAPPGGKRVRANKGLNFPDTDLSVTPLTDKDRQDLDFVVDHADLIGYSFVQSADDVALLQREVQQRLKPNQPLPALVLKIETHRAVRNLPQIMLRAADRPWGLSGRTRL